MWLEISPWIRYPIYFGIGILIGFIIDKIQTRRIKKWARGGKK